MLVLAVLGINVFGDGLRDALDPRAQGRGSSTDDGPLPRSAALSRMIAVLFAISVLTFLIFQAIPSGDPALRARRPPGDPAAVAATSAQQWGFDKPIYVQYVKTMKQDLHGPGDLLHPAGQRARRDQAATCRRRCRWRSAPGSSGCPGRSLRRAQRAVSAGKLARPRADRAVDDRRLDAGVLPRRDAALLPRLQVRALPARRLREAHREPVGVVHAPAHAVVRAVGAVHRRLLARAALDDARHDERGLRAHGAGQGPQRAPGAASATSCATR